MAISPRDMKFLAVYLAQDVRNGAQAYRETISSRGSDQNAANEASKIVNKPDVALMIARFDERVNERILLDAENLTRMWSQVATVDRNELAELRRVCCRHCYGVGYEYQETPKERRYRKQEFERAIAEILAHAKGGVPLGAMPQFDEMGGIGYDRRKPPNGDCPECWGDGIELVIFKDTRKLSPAAKAVYEGVRVTRDGMEVKMFSRADAAAQLAKRWGIGGDKPPPDPGARAPGVAIADPLEASKHYARLMDRTDDE